MRTTERTEARILDANSVLVAPSTLDGEGLIRDFYGSVITPDDLSSGSLEFARKTIYLCGDISEISGHYLNTAARVFVIRELSHRYNECDGNTRTLVDLGRVPVRVHGAGVYYRRFFDSGVDHFNRICTEHAFQSLTESTKPGTACLSGSR